MRRPQFKETGGLIEDMLGGKGTYPALDVDIVDKMDERDQLVNVDYDRYRKDPEYRRRLARLPVCLRELVSLAKTFNETRSEDHKRQLLQQMRKIKNDFGDSALLRQALTRYVIRSQPENVDPSEPGALDDRLPLSHRRNFIYHLHMHVCDKLGISDYSLVKWYSALNTPLDFMYKTDGFFVVDGSAFADGKRRIATVDITSYRPKAEGAEAGSIVLYVSDDIEDLTPLRDRFAAKIVDVLGNRGPDRFLDGFNLDAVA